MAVTLSIIVIAILLLMLSTQPASEVGGLATQKLGESALFTLKNNGGLEQVVDFLDVGNTNQANKRAVKIMTGLQIGLGAKLRLDTYDSGMGDVHNFEASYGDVSGQLYASSIAFGMNGNSSKYVIATLYIGE